MMRSIALLSLLLGIVSPHATAQQPADSLADQVPAQLDSTAQPAGGDTAVARAVVQPLSAGRTENGGEEPRASIDTSSADAASGSLEQNQGAQSDTAATSEPSGPLPENPLKGLLDRLEQEAARVQSGIGEQTATLRQALSPVRLFVAILLLLLAYAFIGLVGRGLSWLARVWPNRSGSVRRTAPLVRSGMWLAALWMVAGYLFGGSPLLLTLIAIVVIGLVIFAILPVVRDLLAGMVLLIERPFEAGNLVSVAGTSGRVQRVGLRSVHLALEDGSMLSIPNTSALQERVVSTPRDSRAHRVEIRVPLRQDLPLEAAMSIAKDAAASSPHIASGHPIEIRLSEPDGFATVVAFVADAEQTDVFVADVRRLTHA